MGKVNKDSYRLVFSHLGNMLVAVAETATATGKEAGQTPVCSHGNARGVTSGRRWRRESSRADGVRVARASGMAKTSVTRTGWRDSGRSRNRTAASAWTKAIPRSRPATVSGARTGTSGALGRIWSLREAGAGIARTSRSARRSNRCGRSPMSAAANVSVPCIWAARPDSYGNVRWGMYGKACRAT
ncbi:hypothetical protein F3J19_05615 [Burkholderia sp. Ax-1724]|nr:hypothetical protein [Burkholderia sp. Ax-1724]